MTCHKKLSLCVKSFVEHLATSTGPFASNFDPFSQASMNVYLMNFNVAGGLATYDFYSQYVELAGRMFGAYMNYTYNPVTKNCN
jgi:hypothetical protein